jgi:hypothetical protein
MAAERNYGQSFNQQKSTPVFNYVYDSSLNSGSGAWTPQTQAGAGGSTDMAPTNIILRSGVANTAPASITSSVNFTGSFGVTSAREVNSVFGYCSGNAQFLRIYDGTGTNGTLIGTIAVSQQNNFSVDFNTHGVTLSAGIFVAFSSSPSSHVATGPDGIISIIWK